VTGAGLLLEAMGVAPLKTVKVTVPSFTVPAALVTVAVRVTV
jgi:hypothetical protein